MNQSRPNKVTFRLSDSEKKQFEALIKETGCSQQSFLVKVIFQKKMVNQDLLRQLIYELKKQGTNLNQIARSCNTQNTEFEKERINTTLTIVNSLLLKAWKLI